MVRLTCRIKIGDTEFDYVNNCEIHSSWEDMTSTAVIVLPKRVDTLYREIDGGEFSQYKKVPAVFTGPDRLFNKKDAVEIYAGYDGNNKLRFKGVVTRVDPQLPLTIYCEDEMFMLKQKTVKKLSLASASLDEILKAIIPAPYTYQTEDIRIGKFKIENASVIETLDYLKKTFGFMVWFREGVIHCGLKYQTNKIELAANSKLPVFHFQHNIIESGSLEFKEPGDVSYQVQVINIKDKNKRHEITVGDVDGEIRTLHFYDAKDSDLEKLANEQLNRMKYQGFRGSFTTFLEPMVQHGDAVHLVDGVMEDRNGKYMVKAVDTKFGVGGGRQTIELDQLIEIV
jgi:hypothetical protein